MLSPIHVAMIDDRLPMLEVLSQCLSRSPDIIVQGVFANANDLERYVEQYIVEVLLIDIALLEVIQEVVRLQLNIQIVALTHDHAAGAILSAFQAGAHAYVDVHAPCDNILHAIVRASQHQSYVEPAIAVALNTQFSGQMKRLTDPETAILAAYAAGVAENDIFAQFSEVITLRALNQIIVKSRDV